MELGFSHLLGVTYLVVIKGGYTTVLSICSAYIRKCVENEIGMKKKKSSERDMKKKSILNTSIPKTDINNYANSKIKKLKELTFSKRIFQTHLVLLFIPLIFSSAFYTGSLYIASYAGNMADMMKQMPFLIFTMNFTIGFVFIIIPLLI